MARGRDAGGGGGGGHEQRESEARRTADVAAAPKLDASGISMTVRRERNGIVSTWRRSGVSTRCAHGMVAAVYALWSQCMCRYSWTVTTTVVLGAGGAPRAAGAPARARAGSPSWGTGDGRLPAGLPERPARIRGNARRPQPAVAWSTVNGRSVRTRSSRDVTARTDTPASDSASARRALYSATPQVISGSEPDTRVTFTFDSLQQVTGPALGGAPRGAGRLS